MLKKLIQILATPITRKTPTCDRCKQTLTNDGYYINGEHICLRCASRGTAAITQTIPTYKEPVAETKKAKNTCEECGRDMSDKNMRHTDTQCVVCACIARLSSPQQYETAQNILTGNSTTTAQPLTTTITPPPLPTLQGSKKAVAAAEKIRNQMQQAVSGMSNTSRGHAMSLVLQHLACANFYVKYPNVHKLYERVNYHLMPSYLEDAPIKDRQAYIAELLERLTDKDL